MFTVTTDSATQHRVACCGADGTEVKSGGLVNHSTSKKNGSTANVVTNSAPITARLFMMFSAATRRNKRWNGR